MVLLMALLVPVLLAFSCRLLIGFAACYCSSDSVFSLSNCSFARAWIFVLAYAMVFNRCWRHANSVGTPISSVNAAFPASSALRNSSSTSAFSCSSSLFAYAQLNIWRLLALALILVRFRLTVPNFNSPMVSAINRISTNKPSSSCRNRLRKIVVVSWSGWMFAQM